MSKNPYYWLDINSSIEKCIAKDGVEAVVGQLTGDVKNIVRVINDNATAGNVIIKKHNNLCNKIAFRSMVGLIFAGWAIYEIHQLKERTVLLNREIKRLKEDQEGDLMFDD